MIKELEELRVKAQEKRRTLANIFDKCKTGEGTYDFSRTEELEGDKGARLEQIAKMNEELNRLGEEIEKLEPLEIAEKQAERAKQEMLKANRPELPKAEGAERKEYKSFGERFVDSIAYKKKGEVATIDMSFLEFKTDMTTAAGWAPETTRIGRVIDDAQRPIQVTDIFPAGVTGQSSVVFMEETTFTNNAAETAEAGTYPEAALALTEQTSPVRKIATFLPITDEQLEDVAAVSGYVNRRLRFMLMQRLDGQVLTGNGAGANLTGVLNASGLQTQALGGDTVPDAIYKAMDLVRVTGRGVPTNVIIHPTDWQAVRLLKTTDGAYVWGAPMDSGVQRIWGVPVTVSDAITLNTALVGDFVNYSELYTRRGIDVQVSNSHSTYFVEGKQAIRADVRVALVIYRGAAFCQVTGI